MCIITWHNWGAAAEALAFGKHAEVVDAIREKQLKWTQSGSSRWSRHNQMKQTKSGIIQQLGSSNWSKRSKWSRLYISLFAALAVVSILYIRLHVLSARDSLVFYPEVSKQLLPVLGVTGTGSDEKLWELLESRYDWVGYRGIQGRCIKFCPLEGCMCGGGCVMGCCVGKGRMPQVSKIIVQFLLWIITSLTYC